MRSASTALISALLARQPLYSADLFTISLIDGTTLRWTSADFDITYGGEVWSARGPMIDRTAWATKNTTEVPEMTIEIGSTGLDFGSINLKRAAHDGLFDGAYLLLQRAFMPSFGDTTLGLVTLFGGRFGAIEITALSIKATCTASNVLMAQNLPRRAYQARCTHTLYDAGCTLSAAAFTDHYVVLSANRIAINWFGSAVNPPSRYLFGTMRVTSGIAAGEALTVSSAATNGVAFGYPLLNIPAPGDSFSLTWGCDKSMATCQNTFANLLNFGGFPYIPAPSIGI